MIGARCSGYRYAISKVSSVLSRESIKCRKLCATKRVEEEDHLFSNKVTFAEVGVSDALSESLNELNFKWATPIQELSYKAVHSGKDVIIGSETGAQPLYLSYISPLYLSYMVGLD